MGSFDGTAIQGIAQGVRHGLRIAEIAHEITSSLANGGDRGLPCRPVRQWRGRRKSIRSPSQKGAGGGCISPPETLSYNRSSCQSKPCSGAALPPLSTGEGLVRCGLREGLRLMVL